MLGIIGWKLRNTMSHAKQGMTYTDGLSMHEQYEGN